MKVLAIVAILVGLAATAASVFAKVETHGNYEYMNAKVEAGEIETKYDVPLRDEYKSTLEKLHLVAWIAGGLALLLGAAALAKSSNKVLPIIAIVLGAAGVAASFLSPV